MQLEGVKKKNDRLNAFKRVSPPRGADTRMMGIGVMPFKYAEAKPKYFIQLHSCPNLHCDCMILTCTCPSFTIQKPARGIDPFNEPCKHVEELQSVENWLRLAKGGEIF